MWDECSVLPCADDSGGGYALAGEAGHQQEHEECHADCWQVLGGLPQGSAGLLEPNLCTKDSAQAHAHGMPVLGWPMLSCLLPVVAMTVMQVAAVHLVVVQLVLVHLVPAQHSGLLPQEPLPRLWVCLSPASCVCRSEQQSN